jgi:hypothetical protein
MASRHTTVAECEVFFTFPGLAEGEREVAYPKLEIEYLFNPGRRPSFDDPGYSAELQLIKATLIDSDGLGPSDSQVQEWAQAWLDDDGYDQACNAADEDHHRGDPDAAYDRWRDEGGRI